MDIAVVGAGIAGLSAAWRLRREGHRVLVFERNYKPGGRMNSRRKAGLVVDHGDRFIYRDSAVLRELIVDCGLSGELRKIDKPIFLAQPDGTLLPGDPREQPRERLTFPDGLLALPEGLRRTLGGFYSIGVTTFERDEVLGKFVLRTEPPLRSLETQVDAVVVACAAPEALLVSEPVHPLLHPEFVQALAQIRYTRCLTLIAALPRVELPVPFYGIHLPRTPDALVHWAAFEDQKCRGREVDGWSSLVAHSTPAAAELFRDLGEEEQRARMYAEVRRFIPQLPERWRWARIKAWPLARLCPGTRPLTHPLCPAALPEVLVEFCGDYRAGDGVEPAAQSGRDAAERLLARMAAPAHTDTKG